MCALLIVYIYVYVYICIYVWVVTSTVNVFTVVWKFFDRKYFTDKKNLISGTVNVFTVVRKFFDRKYFIDKNLTFSKYFYLEHISLAIIHALQCYTTMERSTVVNY